MSFHITTPLIMAFNVQEMPFSLQEFSKKSPYRGATPSPRSVASLPRFGPHGQILAAPLLLEDAQGAMFPLKWRKRNIFKRGNIMIGICHLTLLTPDNVI